jgi:hypothetical protein
MKRLVEGLAARAERAGVASLGDSLSTRLEEADSLLTEPEDADDREDHHKVFQSAWTMF